MAESVITFGGDETPRRAIFRDLGRDRRLPVLVAGLGAVAAFGSLFSEWQKTTLAYLNVEGEEVPVERVVLSGLIDLGALGAGYLVGLLLLVVAVVLVLFGPAPGRAYARVAGLAVGGVLAALLLSLAQELGDASTVVPKYLAIYDFTGMGTLRMTQGRGVWCALAAVGLALIALWLPARAAPAPAEPQVTEVHDELDMTIAPTTPFASYPGELDQPHRS
ncbi:hypothetical protein [Actinoplanes subglobosus]|uniref:Uncharacterized protein n=1 Tax=Actinoplanes subglobosus TaxID=1547892 RepID=A0ABV8IS95_9ACTN